ncbi:MAG: hypothetical protein JW993_06940 [Sedimentisphaerales bacterium]|nr:hypothetical protein [Sedimentisphaerales bacterium]
MRTSQRTVWADRSYVIPMFAFVLSVLSTLAGCSGPPRLTAEDRRRDIKFLARWARAYSPLVELNERQKGTPSYEALLPTYLEYAGQAQSNEEFYQVVSGYFSVIGASGHAYLVSDDLLKWNAIGSLFGVVNLGVTPVQFQSARYWPRLAANLSTRAHPPFRVVGKDGRYFTGDDWQSDGASVPKGSEILWIDGMTCSDYLDYIKRNTSLKYDAYPKGWVDYFLMIVDEGPSFRGWQVDFRLPDNTELVAFVPKVKGFPAPADDSAHPAEPKANCTCVELADDVGYIHIRSFLGSPLDHVFRRFVARDRKKIEVFLKRSHGKYNKLIVDIRSNGGGFPQYYYDNLIAPFLTEPVTWKETVGVKRAFLRDTKPSVLRYLRRDVKPRQISEEELEPPSGFDRGQWVFYEITRKVEPAHRYGFRGTLYVLIDGNCFSAADGYADVVKRTRIGTLVGRNTGGARVSYLLPPMVRLPSSGMIFRMEADLDLTPDGSFNELVGTEPDVKLPPADPPASITREDLLKDEWVKKVIAGP